MPTERVTVSLLGPVTAALDGAEVRLSPLPRLLLARLALDVGRIVSVDRLVDDLWPTERPDDPARALRYQILQLRNALEPDRAPRSEGRCVLTRPPGYVLASDLVTVDADVFEGRCRAALGETERDPATARRILDEALGLWHGPALADLSDNDAMAEAGRRLDALRVDAIEARIIADLACGRDVELLDQLSRLVDEHPYRERLWGALMIASYRAGRQVEALDAYRRAREILGEELGLEPGPELRSIEHQVLLHDERLRGDRMDTIGQRLDPPIVRPGNLPTELTEFVGRDNDLDGLRTRLRTDRFTTVVGVGGTGKTRLAVEAAKELEAEFPDGCWLVELASVQVPEAVPYAVCVGSGLPVPDHDDVVGHVVSRLRHARALIIVDNCEHVLEAAADVIGPILERCPSITVLATSREPLLLAGEQLVGVPPLDLDQAVRLFEVRAASETNQFDAPVHRETVTELCNRLDRLPLAIELAASRVRTMTPGEILAGLDHRFRLLVGGRRTRMERHQTMRGTVDWSYGLCDETERLVFDAVSVFVGDFDLAAARAVVDDHLAAPDVDDALARLVDRSLITRTADADGTSRFSQLETMRAYGRERLVDRGEAVVEAVRARHADHLVATVSALGLRSLGPDEEAAGRRLRGMAPDALVALDHAISGRAWAAAVHIWGGYALAANGLSVAMGTRIGRAKLAADGSFDGIEPTARLFFEVQFGDGDWLALGADRGESIVQRTMQVVRGPVTAPVDGLVNPPVTWLGWELDPEDVDAAEGWVDRLVDHPVATRALNAVWLDQALAEGGYHDRVLARQPELEQLVDSSGSSYLRAQAQGVWALANERAGDIRAAFEHATASVRETDHPTVVDVISANRLVRIATRAGEPIRGRDLRRPYDHISLGALDAWRYISLAASSIALEALDRMELARQALDAIPRRPAEDDFIAMLPGMSDALRTYGRHRSGTADADTVIRAIIELADELDTGSLSSPDS